MRLFVPLAALSLIAGAPAAAQQFDLAQNSRIVRLSDPQLSPDGRSAVVVASRPNYEENRYDAELVLVDVSSRAQKVLSRRRASSPRWSPSGSSLAFLSPVDGKAQIFVMPVDGGEAAQISKAPTGVGSYAWRPDGSGLAYVSEEEAPKREGEERHNRSFEADVNYLLTETPRPYHLWLVPSAGGEARRLRVPHQRGRGGGDGGPQPADAMVAPGRRGAAQHAPAELRLSGLIPTPELPGSSVMYRRTEFVSVSITATLFV